MKKAQKEQAEQLIGLLDRVHDGIRMSVEAGQSENALDLLGQCQDGAISLGEMIEETEGEDCATVRLLEEYCETVYQIYEKIRQGQAVGGSKTQKILRKSLIPIKNSVKNDIQVRTEAVFLPYKASMWDSLESVWKAADEDPNCDAYVIPIPYYDKNSDGSFREEHYEGDQYPDYVPVTWYGDYDFAEHRPDRIFIHNPYDECNYVTSVHPFFYARNLKQYTDQLVYIPYFILSEVDPENTAAVKGMEHFCTTPGVIYADKVIVQSEDMRAVYVNVMTEFAKENGMEGMDRKYWEEKILGLGSPKVDKVLNTRREDLVIPGEWLRVIEKADGSWKKVVFYNTTVTALLKYGEQYLEKMRDVFRVFYENREDVALWWRPHPLMEATVKSMRAELTEAYQEIVREYKSAGWGIYDDSAELDRAIEVCDGYYGDFSSVVELCQKTEKPVLIQNSSIYSKMGEIDNKKIINLVDTVKINDTIWFYPYYFNRLFSMKIKTGETKYYDIPESVEKNNGIANFSSMVHIGKKIYLIPFYAQEILQFNIESEEFISIIIDSKWLEEKKVLFMGTGVYGKYLFLMGACVPVILRIDTSDNSIKYITDWARKIEGIVFNKEDAFFRKQCIFLENKMLVPFCNANAVLEIDCESLKTTIHQLGKEKEGYSGICISKDGIWLSPRYYSKLTKWNMKTNDIQKVELPIHKNGGYAYAGIVKEAERKLLLCIEEGVEVVVEKKDHVYELKGSYAFTQEDEMFLIYYDEKLGILNMYDKETNESKSIEIKIDKSYIKMNNNIFEDEEILMENNDISISFFVNSLNIKNSITVAFQRILGKDIFAKLN